MRSILQRFADWYLAQCDGEWEHGYGIRVQTIDNPGWSVSINLSGTSLKARPFPAIEDRFEDERDWLRCWKEETRFEARCDPGRLEDALTIFLDWAGA